jgi:hypothetical protein
LHKNKEKNPNRILKLDGEDHSKLPNDYPKKNAQFKKPRASKRKLV